MFVFESIDCPTCSGKIRVVVENNKIVSHGICPNCDQAFSAERLQFVEDCQVMEDEFMDLFDTETPGDLYLYGEDHGLPCHPELNIHTCDDPQLCEAYWEIEDFYHLLAERS